MTLVANIITVYNQLPASAVFTALRGWTGTENCASTPAGTITVKFSKAVEFSDHDSVSFVKNPVEKVTSNLEERSGYVLDDIKTLKAN